MLSYILYPILSYVMLSYPVLCYSILCYPILCYPILQYLLIIYEERLNKGNQYLIISCIQFLILMQVWLLIVYLLILYPILSILKKYYPIISNIFL